MLFWLLVVVAAAPAAVAALVFLARERRRFLPQLQQQRLFMPYWAPGTRHVMRAGAPWAASSTGAEPQATPTPAHAPGLTGTPAPVLTSAATSDAGSATDTRAPGSTQRPGSFSHAARDVLHWIGEESDDASARTASPTATRQSGTAEEGRATGTPSTLPSSAADEGILYVDAAGRFTFANQAGRELLHWRRGDLSLADVLVGGRQEAAALLEAVSRHELSEHPVTLIIGAPAEQLHVTALALRDRDGKMRGAALFLRRLGGTAAPLADT